MSVSQLSGVAFPRYLATSRPSANCLGCRDELHLMERPVTYATRFALLALLRPSTIF